MIEKKLRSGRKVKIRELSIDKMDELKDIIKMKYYKWFNILRCLK